MRTMIPTIASCCLTIAVGLVCPPSTSAQTGWQAAAPAPAGTGASAATAGLDQLGSADATAPTGATRPSLFKPFVDVVGDFKHLPSWQNVSWLTGGLTAAGVLHPADYSVTREASEFTTSSFKPGAIVGGTPLELGAAFATYAIGRSKGNPRAMSVCSELIRAQLMAQLMTTGVKQAVRRERPDGGGYSFPSGHTAVTFASATVLQQHFGWRVGMPAFAVASYVAASRVQMQRHYLSDVVFGATVGIVAGRTVTIGSGRKKFELGPTAVPGGGGISATWVGQR